MSYLDETVPADTEAVTLGASRIRALKVDLDALIEQIFEDAGTFSPGWIQANGATGGTSMFGAGAIQSADIGNLQVGTAQLAAQAVTNAKIAPGAIAGSEAGAGSSLSAGFTLPTASVGTSQINGRAVGTSQIALQAITAALLAPGLITGAAIGSYAGSNSSSASVSSLSFNPDVVIFSTPGLDGFGIAFQSEAVSGVSPVHVSWSNIGTVSPNVAAVQWQTGGFIYVPSNVHFNQNNGSVNKTTYIALSI